MIDLPPALKGDGTLSKPRRIRFEVDPPRGNFDIKVVVLNRSGRVVATALRWLRIEDMQALGGYLEKALLEKGDRTKKPFVVAIDREGRVFYQESLDRAKSWAQYLGRAIHFTYFEIFDPDSL